jgi:predicted ATP-grasp superfamily ATP-dependent carboligase
LPPAIVIGGTTVSLGVVRALGKEGVPVIVLHYEENDIAYHSRYAISHEKVPHPEYSEDQFLQALIRHIRDYGARIIFPVSDQAVVTVSRNRALLEQHCSVACTDRPTAELFIDKKNTYQFADQHGVPAPATVVPHSIEDVERFSAEIDFPCLVKPSQSHLFEKRFGRKMLPAKDRDEAISAYSMSAKHGLEILLQEIIPGEDANVVNYNAFFIDGNPVIETTAVHIRNGPPTWGSPRVALSKHVPEVIEPGRRILKAVGYCGFACTEFKLDARDQTYKLMEVNVRHNMSTLLSVRSGINFPWLEYRYVIHGDMPRQPETEEGIYWIDLIRDIGHSLMNFRNEGFTLADYLRPYRNQRVFAVWDFADRRPFRKWLATRITKGFKKVASGH